MSVSVGGGPASRDMLLLSYPTEAMLLDMHGVRGLPPRPLRPGDMLVDHERVGRYATGDEWRVRCGLVVGACDGTALHVLWSAWA